MKAYPWCIGNLDNESDWCNKECPKLWLQECVDRLISKVGPCKRKDILMQLKFRDQLKRSISKNRKKSVAGGEDF